MSASIGVSPGVSAAFRAQAASAELRQGGPAVGERFGDFSAFAVQGDGQVGLGRARSSIDVVHAARLVADHLVEG